MTEQLEASVAGMDEEALFATASRAKEPLALQDAAARELVRRDPRRVGPLLARLVRDEMAPPETRAVAALELGKLRQEGGEAALQAALGASEPIVVRRAAEALGRIGEAPVLEALRRVPTPHDAAAARALSFAKSLIAYRHGLSEELLSAPLAAPLRGKGPQLVVEPAPASLKAKIEARLPSELPTLPVRVERAVRVACERQEAVVLPANEPATLKQRSAIAAVVMKRAHSLGHLATHLYLLSHPVARDRIALFAMRPDGTMTHLGKAWPDDGGLLFELDALDTPSSDPVRIGGRVSPDGAIMITEAVGATAPRSPLPAPKKTEVPPLAHPLHGTATQSRAR